MMPDAVTAALIQAGPMGAVVLFFMWLHVKQQKREEDREARQDAREERQGERIETIITAVNHLVRMTAIEVMSRPHVVQRGKDETQEILSAIDSRGKGQ